eukprot:1150273-Pelagomonas_calceolata.AAC.6
MALPGMLPAESTSPFHAGPASSWTALQKLYLKICPQLVAGTKFNPPHGDPRYYLSRYFFYAQFN